MTRSSREAGVQAARRRFGLTPGEAQRLREGSRVGSLEVPPQEDPILVARSIDPSTGEFHGLPNILAAAPRAELVALAARRFGFTPAERQTFDLVGSCYVVAEHAIVRIVERVP